MSQERFDMTKAPDVFSKWEKIKDMADQLIDMMLNLRQSGDRRSPCPGADHGSLKEILHHLYKKRSPPQSQLILKRPLNGFASA